MHNMDIFIYIFLNYFTLFLVKTRVQIILNNILKSFSSRGFFFGSAVAICLCRGVGVCDCRGVEGGAVR